jgi:hypothetical protein
MSSSKGQFESGKPCQVQRNTNKKLTRSGYQPEVQHQPVPGLEKNLDPQPLYEHLPTPDGGKQLYKAAGKLEGKKAIITGGDSGIGRSTAVLYAMEGADVFIAYLKQEEEDAQETTRPTSPPARTARSSSTTLSSSSAASTSS